MTGPRIPHAEPDDTTSLAIQRAEAKGRNRAASFRPDERLDRLIALRDSNRAEFDRVTKPSLRVELGYYETAKAAHDQYGGTT